MNPATPPRRAPRRIDASSAQTTSLELSTRKESRGSILSVDGEVDMSNASALAAELDQIIREETGDVVVDLTPTTFIDSTGLHVLLNSLRRATRQSRRFAVVCPAGPVRRALELARLDSSLGVVDNLAQYEQRAACGAAAATASGGS